MDHKVVNLVFFTYLCIKNNKYNFIMDKPFIYGMSVEGNNFTDREKETKRLKKDFENGINVILISPRRMGKTSLVKKVRSEIDNPEIEYIFER